MTTYYLNTVPTPTGYSYYYTTSRATSSAAGSSSGYSTAPSKRVARSTSSASSGVSPSAFSAAYAKAYGQSASSARPARPAHKSAPSAPAADRAYATPRKCYEPARAATAPAAPVAAPPAPAQTASRKASRPSLRQPRTSFDMKRTLSADNKHVHFADQNQARPPLKQSQTWSAGDKIPQAVRAASAPPPAHPELHPLFAYSRLHRASISYDTAYPPSPATLVDRKTRGALPTATLSEPATSPPIPTNSRLVLTSHKLPWAVVVSPSPAGGRAPRRTPITNLDVLHAVHTTLMRPVTPDEWAALGNGSPAQKKVQAAFERRCAAAGGGWEGGVRRIDWLGGKTRLVGVEPAGAGGVNGTLVFSTPKA